MHCDKGKHSMNNPKRKNLIDHYDLDLIINMVFQTKVIDHSVFFTVWAVVNMGEITFVITMSLSHIH